MILISFSCHGHIGGYDVNYTILDAASHLEKTVTFSMCLIAQLTMDALEINICFSTSLICVLKFSLT